MLNRRHIRIRVLQALYAWKKSNTKESINFDKILLASLNQIEGLYFFLFLYILEFKNYIANSVSDAKKKQLPTNDDLNPNTKFINNKFIELLNSQVFFNSCKDHNLSLQKEGQMFKSIYSKLRETEDYQTYMNSKTSSFDEDKLFVIQIFSKFLLEEEHFQYILNENNIYWDDDLPFISSMVIKTIKQSSSKGIVYMNLFKDKEDKKFSLELFKQTIINSENFTNYISSKISNWEIDRIAEIDLLLMQMSLTEILKIPEIPVKVAINEYIEMAKYYSTPKSKSFVNGILDSLLIEFKKTGKINKIGRGLIE